jgi:predicted peroxiredoxin
MRLGILIRSATHAPHAVGLTHAALRAGHEVALFVMDEGVRVLGELATLASMDGVDVAYCEFSLMQQDVPPASVPEGFRASSQLDNAKMASLSDRVVIL